MRKQIIIGLMLLVGLVSRGQEGMQYLYFHIGDGVNNLSYNLQNGTEKGLSGNSIDAGYSFFFSPNWGFQAGFGLQTFGALSTLNYIYKTPAVDTDGDSYELRINYKNWKEKQRALFIDMPVSIQYRYWIGKDLGLVDKNKLALLVSLGAKVSIPLNAHYKTTGGEIVTTGYFSKWNLELKDMPQHGFLTITDTYTGNVSLKPSYVGILDFGVLYNLNERLDLYLGTYVNYGLNNILTAGSKQVYQPDGVYNGTLASSQTDNLKLKAFGLKVGVFLRLGKTKSSCKSCF